VSDQNWLVVGRVRPSGRKVSIPLAVPAVPDREGETLRATVTIMANGKQRFVVPVTLEVGGSFQFAAAPAVPAVPVLPPDPRRPGGSGPRRRRARPAAEAGRHAASPANSPAGAPRPAGGASGFRPGRGHPLGRGPSAGLRVLQRGRLRHPARPGGPRRPAGD